MARTFILPGTDRKGSVLISNTTTEGGRAYTAFGFHPVESEPSTTTAYAGQVLEPRLVGYSLGNGTRFYNPQLMRLHTYDLLSPFGEGGINGYAYCSGDPVNWSDPSGKSAVWDALAFVGIGFAGFGELAAMGSFAIGAIEARTSGTPLRMALRAGLNKVNLFASAAATAGVAAGIAAQLSEDETWKKVLSATSALAGGISTVSGGSASFSALRTRPNPAARRNTLDLYRRESQIEREFAKLQANIHRKNQETQMLADFAERKKKAARVIRAGQEFSLNLGPLMRSRLRNAR